MIKKVVQITALVLIAALCSCSSQRHITSHSSDSTQVRIHERIERVRDTILVTLPAQRDSVVVAMDTISTLQNSVARSCAKIIDGKLLSHTLETLSSPIPHPIDIELLHRDSVIYRERVTEHIVEVERALSSWQKIQIRGFWMMLLSLGIALGIRRLI